VTACITDCAYAACKWGALKLRTTADGLSGDPCVTIPDAAECALKADLYQMATELETIKLAECVSAVEAVSPYPAIYNTGSLGKNGLGNIENVAMILGCDITATIADEPPRACSESEHTHPIPAPHIEEPGIYAVTYDSLFGAGSTGVLDDDYTINIPTGCGSPPCPFELQEFDIELDDVSVSGFQFEDITLSLAETADGSITGTAVSFAPGEMEFTLSVVVKINGEYLLGTDPYEFPVVNTDAIESTYSSSVFTVQSAVFDYGDVLAILNTDPAVF